MSVTEKARAAKRVSAPIVAINTLDQQATIDSLCRTIDGTNPDTPSMKLRWDFVNGVFALGEGGWGPPETGNEDLDDLMAATIGDAHQLMRLARMLPRGTVLFVMNAHRYLGSDGFVQGICNIRDEFKADNRMIVLLGPNVDLPAELATDAVALDEAPPNREEIGEVIRSLGIEEDDMVERASEAVLGLTTKFQVEQTVAMSLTRDGLVLDDLWERKRQMIRREKLMVYAGGLSFDDIHGVRYGKQLLENICTGPARPGVIVRIEEIEKQIGENADTSGVSKTYKGKLLTFIEDNLCRGIMCVGVPGCSKSLLTKAAGNEFGIPTVDMDLGILKGGLVGQSEEQLERALSIIKTVGNNKVLFVASCNDIGMLDSALLRRFSKTLFFDLPPEESKPGIWDIQQAAFGLAEQDRPSDDLWSGSDIRDCCWDAKDFGISLVEAAQGIVPVGVRSAADIEKYRNAADGCYVSAEVGGVYRKPQYETGGRQISLDD